MISVDRFDINGLLVVMSLLLRTVFLGPMRLGVIVLGSVFLRALFFLIIV